MLGKLIKYDFKALAKNMFPIYGLMIALLGIYAIGWQQVIKHMNLTSAYAAKAATVIWGFIFGVVLFHEKITAGKVIGLALITAGIVLFGIDDGESAA